MGSINISIASKKKCVSQFKLKSKLRGNRIDSYAGLALWALGVALQGKLQR